MSEIQEPSKALTPALLAHSPLSLTQTGHKMKIFSCNLTGRLYVPFYVGHKKNKKFLKTWRNMRNSS